MDGAVGIGELTDDGQMSFTFLRRVRTHRICDSTGLFRWYNSAAGPAQAATETFLTRLERGDTAGAYQLLCADERNRLSQAAFTDLVHARPQLRRHKIVGTSVAVVNGTSTALITVDLTRAG